MTDMQIVAVGFLFIGSLSAWAQIYFPACRRRDSLRRLEHQLGLPYAGKGQADDRTKQAPAVV